MSSRIATWLLTALCVSGLAACATTDAEDAEPNAETADDEETLATTRQALTGVSNPAIVIERSVCESASELARYAKIAQVAAATALRTADLAGNGNGPSTAVFDYKKSFPAAGTAPVYPFTIAMCDLHRSVIGVWFEPLDALSGYDYSSNRRDVLKSIRMLNTGEGYGLRLTNDGIKKLAGYAFQDMPKSLNGAGQYDPNGDLKLSSVTPRYPTSKSLMLDLRGTYDGVFSDTGFNARVTDTLALTSTNWVTCSTKHEATTDLTIDSALNTIFNISGDLNTRLGQYMSRGALCQAVSSIEQDYLIPGTNGKVRMNLDRIDMNATSGITVTGYISQPVRQQYIGILGDLSVTLEPGDEVPPVYLRTTIDDLRAPVTYKWTSTGAVFSGQGPTTYAQWSIGSSPTTYKTVTVTATDADGRTASATRTVVFKRVSSYLDD
jgi:hypothetical protein